MDETVIYVDFKNKKIVTEPLNTPAPQQMSTRDEVAGLLVHMVQSNKLSGVVIVGLDSDQKPKTYFCKSLVSGKDLSKSAVISALESCKFTLLNDDKK